MSEEKTRGRTARSGAGRRSGPTARIGAARAAPTGSFSTRLSGRRGADLSNPIWTIMTVFLGLAALGSTLLVVRLHNGSIAAGNVSVFAPATRAIIITVDGLDPGVLNRTSMPNVRSLQQNGVTYTDAWVGQMETAASTSAATIGSGSFPRSHGIVGDVWYDAKNTRVVRATLPENVLVGSIDAIMEPRKAGSIAAALKTLRPSSRVLSVGGTNCGAAAAVGTWAADYVVCAQRRNGIWSPISVAGHELPTSATSALGVQTRSVARGILGAEMQGWKPGDQNHWIAREATSAMRATLPTLTFVNFPEYAIVQRNVPAARARQARKTILRRLDADIGSLIRESKREGSFKSTIFVLTSGRAFEPIKTRMSYSHLSHAIIAAGGEATYLAGDGAALIGLRDPLQAQPVAQALQAESSSSIDAVYFKVPAGGSWSYSPQYLAPQLGQGAVRALSYLLSTMASTESPDVVVIYRPLAALAGGGKNGVFAAALGVAWPIQHVPLIVSGHGVFADRTSRFPARLVDIAPTVESALGLPAAKSDGVVLQDALFGVSTPSTAQAVERARLAPLTAALQARGGAPAG